MHWVGLVLFLIEQKKRSDPREGLASVEVTFQVLQSFDITRLVLYAIELSQPQTLAADGPWLHVIA